ncbi:hypothetical protein CERZMDRAFT_46997 [Cercospora zeae-maydis SCOH1-5]|uniref:SGNH hydrolase-type esterase domain-containing protein n=1 Tax=Cercospora zeae-maydis SCOH1-5 TaxID=717836 RepID=A0A6A6F7T3_9PEZI|nr:hypothetical protein CERZMDRAFT_46997 [Cercospora zeae-maydis SCOH1-5]
MFLTTLLHPLLASASLASALVQRQDRSQYAPNPEDGHWVDTWVSMPQLTEPANLPPSPFNGSDSIFSNTTIRQTIKTTIGASSHIRLRVSNAFGLTELPITTASVALARAEAGQNQTGASGIDASTLQSITFSGNASITIPPGALAVSDPIPFAVQANQILSINLYVASGQHGFAITSHPGSRTTSWLSRGDQTATANFTDASTASTAHWYLISALEVWAPRNSKSLVIVGDSITDGRGSTTNGNDRWPDQLFSRLQSGSPGPKSLAISNQAAGGNRILADGLGPSALSRIERDVLAHPSVGYALLFEGVNDIGTAASTTEAQDAVYNRLVQAYKQILSRIHADGIPVFGATITPFGCLNSTIQPYSSPEREMTRLRVNEFIRNLVGQQGGFEALVDFDKIVRDPMNETRLRPDLDSGDCLHLNPKGYMTMAEGFPLDVFAKFRDGVSGFV